MELALNFSGPLSASEAEPAVSSELAAAMLLTQPLHGDIISDPTPVLKANLSTFGEFDEATLSLRLSGVGPLPAKFDRENKIIEARPPQPLKPGDYTVVISAKIGARKVETQWSFKMSPIGGTVTPAPITPAAKPL